VNIGLSDITHTFRSHSAGGGASIKHGHAQQLLVAALGYKTLASYQAAKASGNESESFDEIRHVVVDRVGLTQRAAELGITSGAEQLSSSITSAFADRLPLVTVHRSYGDLDELIHRQIEQMVENNGRVIGQMSELNHNGVEEVYFDLEIDFNQSKVGALLSYEVTGHVSLYPDPERPYTGTKIGFQVTLAFEGLGRHCYGEISYEVTGVWLKAPWSDDHDDHGESPTRSMAEVIAELLDWSVDEVGDLQNVDETPLDGSSGEMIYGYLIDFTPHASHEVAARILREHGTLQFHVGPNFFDGVRYDGWPR
jgi:hypothetical protein